jgi:hypothetical protein
VGSRQAWQRAGAEPREHPSEQELRDRDYGRVRLRLRGQRNRLDLQMRAWMRNHDFLIVPEMWWQVAKWGKAKVSETLPH